MRQELSGRVGRIIARHRATLGITQEQLSLALDVDPITISRFERGISLPSLTTIQRLCEIFGISLSEFFAGNAEPAPRPATGNGEAAALMTLVDSLQKDERLFFIDTLKRYCRMSTKRRR